MKKRSIENQRNKIRLERRNNNLSIKRNKYNRNNYIEYLKSSEWAELRNDIINARGNKCERCDSEKMLQVHHITYKNLYNENPEDLEVLCKDCHNAEHKKPLN